MKKYQIINELNRFTIWFWWSYQINSISVYTVVYRFFCELASPHFNHVINSNLCKKFQMNIYGHISFGMRKGEEWKKK